MKGGEGIKRVSMCKVCGGSLGPTGAPISGKCRLITVHFTQCCDP